MELTTITSGLSLLLGFVPVALAVAAVGVFVLTITGVTGRVVMFLEELAGARSAPAPEYGSGS